MLLLLRMKRNGYGHGRVSLDDNRGESRLAHSRFEQLPGEDRCQQQHREPTEGIEKKPVQIGARNLQRTSPRPAFLLHPTRPFFECKLSHSTSCSVALIAFFLAISSLQISTSSLSWLFACFSNHESTRSGFVPFSMAAAFRRF
jgi:hypothetical protein